MVVLGSEDITVRLLPVEALACVTESPPGGSGILLIIPQEASQLVHLTVEKPSSAATIRKYQSRLCPLVTLGLGQDIGIVYFLLNTEVVPLVGGSPDAKLVELRLQQASHLRLLGGSCCIFLCISLKLRFC